MLKLLIISLTFLGTEFSYAVPSLDGESVTRPKWGCHLPDDLNQWGLNTEVFDSICAARKSFDIDIFRSNGRTIVILGESHRKNRTDYENGQELARHFELRGFEAANWNPTMSYPEDYPNAAFLNRYMTTRAEIALQTFSYGSNTKDIAQIGISYFHDGTDAFAKLNGVDTPELDGLDMTENSMTNERIVNIDLERSSAIKVILDENCPYYFDCPAQLKFDLRESDMVNSIDLALEGFPDRGPMLVIVGGNHLPGLRRRLVCDYDYQVHKVARRYIPFLDSTEASESTSFTHTCAANLLRHHSE